MSWEDWKKVQKENAAKAAHAADEEEAQMREYRAQLDADRNKRLAKGTNNAHLRAKARESIRRKIALSNPGLSNSGKSMMGKTYPWP